MRVLFCGGSSKSGSWAMRGIQIASTHDDWIAVAEPTVYDIADADIVVVVKRINGDLIKKIKEAGKPLVYDMLDFWVQKHGVKIPDNLPDAIMLAKNQIAKIQPDAIIAANECMANDLRSCAPTVQHIYHHYRLDAAPVKGGDVIYYDGSIKHAEGWLKKLQKIAKVKIGVPQDDALALFSARDGQAWLPNRWKSNVKAANAIGYGLPLITHPDNGAMETEVEGFFFSNESELHDAVNQTKKVGYSDFVREKYSLASAGKNYERFFHALL